MKELLKDYPEEKVKIFIHYLNVLKNEKGKDGKIIAWWFSKITTQDFAGAFIKVASTGLFIDGDTVTLNYLKKLVVTYDYHAYMNKIKAIYPETIFDFDIVYEGDEFTTSKESGKVIYSHIKANPFNTNKKIIGAYGVIKNSKGEFIETINVSDIEKMKKSSRMAFIWNTWHDRMVKKSIIKRVCSTHFKDEVNEIDIQDNELNDPNRVLLSEEVLKQFDKAKTIKDVTKIYNENINKVENKKQFIEICGKKRKELENDKNS